MKDLLEGVAVVVSSAGAGSVLSALSAARPLVMLPMGLDEPVDAARTTEAGAGRVVESPDRVGAAVAQVLADPSSAAGAGEVAGEVAAMNSADDVLALLLKRLGTPQQRPSPTFDPIRDGPRPVTTVATVTTDRQCAPGVRVGARPVRRAPRRVSRCPVLRAVTPVSGDT